MTYNTDVTKTHQEDGTDRENLYSSTKQALDFLTDYLADGAILVFDDWYCFKGYPHLGEEGACNAWLQENANIKLVPFRRFGWHGMSFIAQVG